jgi:G protein-coupled receptor Mth (Methuselah protein)
MKLLTLALLLLFLSESYSETTRQTSSPNKKVIISKCCRIGDVLSSEGICEVGTGRPKWAPKVFLPKVRKVYDKEGLLPPFLSIKEEMRPECKHPEFFKSTEVYIIANGSLFLTNKHETIDSAEKFCVDQDYSLGCRNDKDTVPDNMTVIKLTKCCGPHEIYGSNSCSPLNKMDPLYNQKLLEGEGINIDYDYKFPDCVESNEFAIGGLFLSDNYDLMTGAVSTDSGKRFEHGQYCLDHVVAEENKNYEGVKIFTCSEHYQTAPPPSISQQHDDTRFAIYSIGLLISVLFLIATLAVGFLLLSNHHMLHWRCQTNYVICLLIGDLLLAITQLSGTSLSGLPCVIIAHLMHFFFLATFFWLNSMCLNIWWTFR